MKTTSFLLSLKSHGSILACLPSTHGVPPVFLCSRVFTHSSFCRDSMCSASVLDLLFLVCYVFLFSLFSLVYLWHISSRGYLGGRGFFLVACIYENLFSRAGMILWLSVDF